MNQGKKQTSVNYLCGLKLTTIKAKLTEVAYSVFTNEVHLLPFSLFPYLARRTARKSKAWNLIMEV
jgi:hypothetical protein